MNRKRQRKRRWVGPAAVFLLLILAIAGNAVSICRYSRVDEKCAADTAIILGAAAGGDQVSPVFRERINHGIWLYQNGYVKTVILTGGYGEGNSRSDADIARQYATSQGLPETAILMEETSTITQENLANAKVLMAEYGLETAIIVSDPLHMKRAMLMAADQGITAFSSPTPTSMYRSFKSRAGFLGREIFFYIGYQLW